MDITQPPRIGRNHKTIGVVQDSAELVHFDACEEEIAVASAYGIGHARWHPWVEL